MQIGNLTYTRHDFIMKLKKVYRIPNKYTVGIYFFEFNGEIIWIPKKYTDGMYTFLNFMVKLFEFQKSIHMGCILFLISWWNYLDSNKLDPVWIFLNKFDQFGSSLNQFDPIWSNLIQFDPIRINLIQSKLIYDEIL